MLMWLKRRRWRILQGAVVAGLACTAATTRPRFDPLPGALVDTLGAGPRTVIAGLAEEVTARGLRVHAVSQAEGYLETSWFDPVTGQSVGQEHLHTERVFRMRAYADSLPPVRSILNLETVYRLTADPSAGGREEERIVPPGQAGDSLTQVVLEALRKRFPR
jgi:hypothetical protein